MDGLGPSLRLPPSVCSASSSLSLPSRVSFVCWRPSEGKGSERGGGEDVRERGSGSCIEPSSGLLQPSVSGTESLWGLETSDRPLSSQRVHHSNPLPDGDHGNGVVLHQERGLHGVDRSVGCLLSSPRTRGFSEVPTLHSGGQGVPVQSSVLRTGNGSSGIHQSFSLWSPPGLMPEGFAYSFTSTTGLFWPVRPRRWRDR